MQPVVPRSSDYKKVYGLLSPSALQTAIDGLNK